MPDLKTFRSADLARTRAFCGPVLATPNRAEGDQSLHHGQQALGGSADDRFDTWLIAGPSTWSGAPGLRPHDHPCDHRAFAFDPDSNHIGAVCREPA